MHPHNPLPQLDSGRYAHLSQPQRVELQAMRSVVEIIESEGYAVRLSGQQWFDVRPMVDDREHSPELVDLNREIIDLALSMGLVARHPAPDLQHLVCVLFTPL